MANSSLSCSSLIGGITFPGKTPLISIYNKGISSATNFGTIVSQTDRNKIVYSNSLISSCALFFYNSSALFMFPADTKTLLRALSPKS